MSKDNQHFADAVRSLRAAQMTFEEIERQLGQKIREAIELVKAEEAEAPQNPKPRKPPAKPPRDRKPETAPPTAFAAPRSSGCGVLDELPALAH